MPYFYYFMIWFLVIFCQIVVTPRMSITGIYPDFILASAILLGLKRGWKAGLWFGFAFGLTVDLTDPASLGWTTLLISLSGFMAGMIREKIYVENNLYQVGIIAGVTFLYNIFIRLVEAAGFLIANPAESLVDSLFIGVYTAIMAGVILIILQQRFRLKELL